VALAVAGGVVVAVLVAVVAQVRRRPSRWRPLVPAAGALVFLTVAHLAVGHGVGPADLRIQLPTRGLALAAILTLQPLAEVLGTLVGAPRRRVLALDLRLGAGPGPDLGGRPAFRRAAAAVPVGAVLGLAVCVPWLLSGPLDPRQVAVPPSASFRNAAAELHRLVPPMGRHLLVTPAATSVGTDFPARWLAAASATNSAHLYFWEATKENTAGVLAADLLWSADPATAVDTLRRAGVTHVVTVDVDQAFTLDQVDGYVPVWTGHDVTIFAVDPLPGRPAPGDLLQPAAEEPLALGLAARPQRQDPEHLAWSATTATDLSVVAAVAYDPGWRAWVDGTPVPVQRSSDGFVQLALPAGSHHIDLRFTANRPHPLGVTLTLTGLIALAATSKRRDRHRHRIRSVYLE
jgi:hypothetical protein